MNSKHLLSLSAAIGLFATVSYANDKVSWDFPQDTPKVQNVSIGLASDRPVDISRFLLARGVSSVSINKQSTHIGYISNVTGRGQIWLRDMATGQDKQLTFGNGVNGFMWHPDGKRVMYAADNDGDERQAYFLMSIDGEQESIVLPHSKAYRQLGDFDANGDKFSYASTERNGRDFDIYLYDFKQQKSTLIYQSEFGFYPQAWQPNSTNLLITEVRGEDATNLHLLNSKTGKLTTLFKPEVAANFASFTWKKDGSGFYTSSDLDAEFHQVLFHDVVNNKTQVIAKSRHDLEDVNVCADEQYLAWTENDNGFDKLHVKTLASGDVEQINIPGGSFSLECSDDTDTLIVAASSYQAPTEVYYVNLASSSVEKVFSAQMAGIDRNELVKPEVVTFKARDGVTVQGLLYMPKKSQGLKPPVVFGIHGGPTAQAIARWNPLSQYLTGKGIAYFDINVRGSTGFGKTYARLDNQEKRLDSVRDLVDALAFFEKDGRVDASRAAAIGGSYGGYMVNAVMGLYPDAFKAGASFVGVADWVRALQTASPGLKASDRIEYGDIRDPKWQKFYEANSPINTVHNIKAAMFYEHGVNDPRDPVTESDEMVRALRQRDIPVTYLRFPDEGHRISKMKNRIIFYRELAKYLEKHL